MLLLVLLVRVVVLNVCLEWDFVQKDGSRVVSAWMCLVISLVCSLDVFSGDLKWCTSNSALESGQTVFSGEQECACKLSNFEDKKYDAKNMFDLMTNANAMKFELISQFSYYTARELEWGCCIVVVFIIKFKWLLSSCGQSFHRLNRKSEVTSLQDSVYLCFRQLLFQ